MLSTGALYPVGPAKIDHSKDKQSLIDRLQFQQQGFIADQCGEGLVEGRIKLGQILAGPVFGVLPDCLPRFPQSAQCFRWRPAADENFDHIKFERKTNLVDFFDLAKIDLPNRVTAVCHPLHEPVGGQHSQRLAHGAAAHIKFAAKRLLS